MTDPAMDKGITLCSFKRCPWSHWVELALIESGVEYKRLEVDRNSKHARYHLGVNPKGKAEIPTIMYGKLDSQSSILSVQSLPLTNATIIVEFLVNLSTTDPLLPATPKGVQRMHRFIEELTSNFIPNWNAITSLGSDPTSILPAIEALQDLLPPDGYAVGQWSIADGIAAAFLSRAIPCLNDDVGPYRESEKYTRFKKYYLDLTSRESFKRTFHENVNAVVALSSKL